MSRPDKNLAKIAIALPVILILALFSLSLHSLSSPVVLGIFPQVPKEGMPVTLSFSLTNYHLFEKDYNYEFYANGRRVLEGSTTVGPLSSREYRYVYKNPLKLGERVNFVVTVSTQNEVYEQSLSIPAYPPQVWSSFVSFATFSTSMGTFLTSMPYYQDSFGLNQAFNVGVIFSVILIMILIQVELTEPFTKTMNMLGRLRSRFNRLSAVLFMIFIAMIFTQIVLIIGG
jgi:hypothetical protein